MTEESWHNSSRYTHSFFPGSSSAMLDDLDLNSITDERARELVRRLLNVVEDVMADLRAAHAENQRLRDEINRLKGEQGTPVLEANKPQKSKKDHSPERQRHQQRGGSQD